MARDQQLKILQQSLVLVVCMISSGFIAGRAYAQTNSSSTQTDIADIQNSTRNTEDGESSNLKGMLSAALDTTRLARRLSDPKGGPYTIFAPEDAAFEKLNMTRQDILDLPNLKNIIKYHVVEGYYTTNEINDGMELCTLSGPCLTFTVDDTANDDNWTVTVNGAKVDATVVHGDVYASNGIVHFIDNVLLPPDPAPPPPPPIAPPPKTTTGNNSTTDTTDSKSDFETTVPDLDRGIDLIRSSVANAKEETPRDMYGSFMNGYMASASGEEDIRGSNRSKDDTSNPEDNLSILTEALMETQLGEELQTLTDGTTFTMFAPSDEAFEELLDKSGITRENVKDLPGLKNILLYHIVPVRADSKFLEKGQEVCTLLDGACITTELKENGDLIINNEAKVMVRDGELLNGVVHVIDGVLNPPDWIPSGDMTSLSALGESEAAEEEPARGRPFLGFFGGIFIPGLS